MNKIAIVQICILFFLMCCSGPENRKVPQTENKSTETFVDMPNLIDLSLRDAKEKLREKNLVVKNVEYVLNPDSFIPLQNLVLKVKFNGKEINPGTKLPEWSELTLVVAMTQEDIDKGKGNK